MIRLIAIQGPGAGGALPVREPITYLAAGPAGRPQLAYGGEPPSACVAIQLQPGGVGHAIRWVDDGQPEAGPRIALNGEPLEATPLPLHHGDMLQVGETTLLFDSEVDDPHVPSQAAREEMLSSSGFLPGPQTDDAGLLGADSILYRRSAHGDALALAKSAVAGLGAPAGGEAERLRMLLQASATLTQSLDLEAVLCRLLDLVFEVTPATRGTVLLTEAGPSLRSAVAKVRGEPATPNAYLPISRTILREAIQSREAILTADAAADQRFMHGASIATSGIASAVCCPLIQNERLLGVLQLDTVEGAEPLDEGHTELLLAIGALGGLAIENAQLYRQAQEQERIRYELQLAASIQQQLLPKSAPSVQGLDVFGRMQPAREVGGDVYDVLATADGELHAFVGDVAGKGVGAGLIMAMARSYVRSLWQGANVRSPKAVVVALNRLLFADTASDKFMSGVILRWSPDAATLTYCGAGQENVLLFHGATGECEAIPAGGVALAVVEDSSAFLEERALVLAPGDLCVLYTDGAIDAHSRDGETFGLPRLQREVRRLGRSGKSASVVVDALFDRIAAFARGADPYDDITLLAFRRV